MNIAKGRIVQKIDTSINWENNGDFVPLRGECVVYLDEKPKIKFGDGITKIANLSFITGVKPITIEEIEAICNKDFMVDIYGNATIPAAWLSVDNEGNANLIGKIMSVDEDGNAIF